MYFISRIAVVRVVSEVRWCVRLLALAAIVIPQLQLLLEE